MSNPRPICAIASDILADWPKPSPYALPYLNAMRTLNSVADHYYLDSGHDIVCRFICNAAAYRGPKAKELKNELRATVGLKLAK